MFTILRTRRSPAKYDVCVSVFVSTTHHRDSKRQKVQNATTAKKQNTYVYIYIYYVINDRPNSRSFSSDPDSSRTRILIVSSAMNYSPFRRSDNSL